jgi:hypothetical protein
VAVVAWVLTGSQPPALGSMAVGLSAVPHLRNPKSRYKVLTACRIGLSGLSALPISTDRRISPVRPDRPLAPPEAIPHTGRLGRTHYRTWKFAPSGRVAGLGQSSDRSIKGGDLLQQAVTHRHHGGDNTINAGLPFGQFERPLSI